MAKKIGLAVIALIAILFIYAGLQSAEYTVSRSIHIDAPAEKVFPYLSNTVLAEEWAPWKAEDPQVVTKNPEPTEGVGAKSIWESPGKMGHGSATIIAIQPLRKVGIKLEYTKPMKMEQDAEYILEPAPEGGVNMTWKVHGTNNIIGRVMCIFMSMDKMVGGMFEKGLANLKAVAEKK